MNRKGKVTDEWIKVRKHFLASRPPNHQGYYVCYLCSRWIPSNEITVDHIIARTRDQSLRFVFSNLAFACAACNEAKGSKPAPTKELIKPDHELDGLW